MSSDLAGTRQLEVLAVGMQPVARIMDVPESGTADINIPLERVCSSGRRTVFHSCAL